MVGGRRRYSQYCDLLDCFGAIRVVFEQARRQKEALSAEQVFSQDVWCQAVCTKHMKFQGQDNSRQKIEDIPIEIAQPTIWGRAAHLSEVLSEGLSCLMIQRVRIQ